MAQKGYSFALSYGVNKYISGVNPARDEGDERKTIVGRERRSSHPKRLDAGPFEAEVGSFWLHMAAEGKAGRTLDTYTGPLTPNGIYQAVARAGERAGVAVYPHGFRHHFSHTWLDRGGAPGPACG